MFSRKLLTIAVSGISLAALAMPQLAEAGHRHHHGGRYHYHDHHRRHHDHHHNRGGEIAAGIIVGGAVAAAVANNMEVDRDQEGTYRERRDQHIAWCSRHFGSYDPGTDRYLSESGRPLRCNSPYD